MKPISFLALFIVANLYIACQPPDPLQQAKTRLKPVVDTYFIYAWSLGRLDTLAVVCDPQMVRYEGTSRVDKGLEAVKRFITAVRTEHPDFKVALEDEVYVGDRAMIRATISGTNTGPGEFSPTGKSFKVNAFTLLRIKDGKIVEEWVQSDGLTLMQQLGFTMAPPIK